jgi:undecaprenyl phosphate-alpha-L-ara4N flippase subunit ArnF
MNTIKANAVVLLILSIVLSACAQLLMKASMIELHAITDIEGSIVQLIDEHRTAFVWLVVGLGFYAISMLAWMLALTKYELSFAYPLLGVTYILVYLGAVYWPQIGEQLSWQRSAGILLILIGVALINRKKTSINDERES